MVKQQILDLDKSERVILDIKRHPIGLYAIYLFGFGSTLALLALLFAAVASDSFLDNNFPDIAYIGLFSFLIFIFVTATWIGSHVYKQNELVVTNENIIQILQFGLFNKQVSQLNLAKIQDVSVDQQGIVQSIFQYGTVEIETAGEASNFKFKYAANPNKVAKVIIEAHEDFVRAHPGSTSRI